MLWDIGEYGGAGVIWQDATLEIERRHSDRDCPQRLPHRHAQTYGAFWRPVEQPREFEKQGKFGSKTRYVDRPLSKARTITLTGKPW